MRMNFPIQWLLPVGKTVELSEKQWFSQRFTTALSQELAKAEARRQQRAERLSQLLLAVLGRPQAMVDMGCT